MRKGRKQGIQSIETISMKAEKTAISDQLRLIREQSHISTPELAQLIGTSFAAVQQWERSYISPSPQQQKKISELLEKIQRGEIVRPASLVLQNGTFASRGATRQGLQSKQSDLFTRQPKVQIEETPAPSLFSIIKNGQFIMESEDCLKEIFADRSMPARTESNPVILEMSAGKNTYTYDAHTYHTKVPPQGIAEFINHYLPEGGLVFDPFSGSGMTGVAARIAGTDVILNELSPAACFISHNFTEAIPSSEFCAAIKVISDAVEEVRRQLYTTGCRECGKDTEILYTVWSYRALCPDCKAEFLLWDHCRKYGRTVREHKILKEFPCPSCGQTVKKRSLGRTTSEPVMLGYKCCGKSQVEHQLTDLDLAVINEADTGCFLEQGYFPVTELPDGVNLKQPMKHGLTSIDRFYTMRNLSAMSHLWKQVHRLSDPRLASSIAFIFTSLYQRVTRLSEYRFWGGSGNTARFNVPFIFNEANVFVTFERKAASILDHLETTAVNYKGRKAVVCNSATELNYIPDDSVDFIFTDPPFGSNINYSEMNILWEAWLGEFTDNTREAIVNSVQGKSISDYENLMRQSLSECYRVLRKGHWMLLVFMNSSKDVWEALINAVHNAGFIIERLDIFDKQHGTFKQFVSNNTAGCDLVLHCRKQASADSDDTRQKAVKRDESIIRFMAGRKDEIPTTEFLHVTRDNEPDLRRLYSEWLMYALPQHHELADFSTFRDLINQITSVEGNVN